MTALRVPDWQPQLCLEPLATSWLDAAGVELAVLRLDAVDRQVSGNKWFKLLPHLQTAAHQGCRGVMTLGGPHSNHLHAVAAAGHRFGFETLGLVRGDAKNTPTIADLVAMGMQIEWLGYGDYRARYNVDFWLPWKQRYPHLWPVPEGGGGLTGAAGCTVLIEAIGQGLPQLGWSDYSALWLAAGTGSTVTGLVMGEQGRHPVYVALAVPLRYRVPESVRQIVADMLECAKWMDAHCHWVDGCRRGFGRFDPQLLDFMAGFEEETGVLLDPVYTGKAILALRDSVQAGRFAPGTRLVFIHTGGLQGRRAAGL